MFQKKKMKEKKPIQEPPKPQKIDELKETTEEEVKEAEFVRSVDATPVDITKEEELFDVDDVEEQDPIKNKSYEAPEEVDGELTENDVREWMRNVAVVVDEQNRRLARIEHHLRIDFD